MKALPQTPISVLHHKPNPQAKDPGQANGSLSQKDEGVFQLALCTVP